MESTGDSDINKEKQALNAAVAREAAKLVQQDGNHKQARRNAEAIYRSRIKALKTSVGGLAVQHGLVNLTKDALEGLFIEAAAAIEDPARVAAWSDQGKAARAKREAERVAERQPKRDFCFGRNTEQSEALQKGLRAAGFRLATDSAPYWKLLAVDLPKDVIGLAQRHGEKLWSYDDEGDKVMIYAPPEEKPAALQRQFTRKPGVGSVSIKRQVSVQADTHATAPHETDEPRPSATDN